MTLTVIEQQLQELEKDWERCQKCPLHFTRHHVVHARYGNSNEPQVELSPQECDVLFIGEAPGEIEDSLGFPFLGPAGKMLNRIIREANSKAKDLWYSFCITNTIACAPWLDKEDPLETKIRPPTDYEQNQCRPRVLSLIEILQPQAIILLGKVASSWWKKTYKERGIRNLRDILVGMQVLEIVHPSYILRSATDDPTKTVDFKRAVVYLREFIAANNLLEK